MPLFFAILWISGAEPAELPFASMAACTATREYWASRGALVSRCFKRTQA